jgi:hypothetical protein
VVFSLPILQPKFWTKGSSVINQNTNLLIRRVLGQRWNLKWGGNMRFVPLVVHFAHLKRVILKKAVSRYPENWLARVNGLFTTKFTRTVLGLNPGFRGFLNESDWNFPCDCITSSYKTIVSVFSIRKCYSRLLALTWCSRNHIKLPWLACDDAAMHCPRLNTGVVRWRKQLNSRSREKWYVPRKTHEKKTESWEENDKYKNK